MSPAELRTLAGECRDASVPLCRVVADALEVSADTIQQLRNQVERLEHVSGGDVDPVSDLQAFIAEQMKIPEFRVAYTAAAIREALAYFAFLVAGDSGGTERRELELARLPTPVIDWVLAK